MSEQLIKATENTINNSIKGLDRSSSSVLDGFISKTKFNSLSAFTGHSSRTQRGASGKLNKLNKKHKNDLKSKLHLSEINAVISDSKSFLSLTNLLSIKTATNLMNGFTSRLNSGITSNVNRIINSELLKLQNKIGIPEYNANISAINMVVYNANSLANQIKNNHLLTTATSIASIESDLVKGLNVSLNNITSLVPKSNPLEDLKNARLTSALSVNAFSKTKYDFFQRKSEEASTSKYIQAIIPDRRGLPKPNPKILTETPDAKIITPKLKKDTNVVKSLVSLKDSLLKSLPKVEAPAFLDGLMNASSTLSSVAKGISAPTISDVAASKVGISVGGMTVPNLNAQSMASPIIPSILSDSPLSKATPDIVGTSDIEVPSLGSLMSGITPVLSKGAAPSIIPSKNSKEIKEEAPTGNKAEYGKIQVKENKGGFVEISDETPGNVRKINLHPSGTYDAKLDNGDAHTKTTGKKVDIVDGNWEVTIFEDSIQIINKNTKIEIREDKFENIHGSQDLNIDKSKKTKVGGDVSNDYGASLSEKISEDCLIDIGGNQTNSVGGNYNGSVKGNSTEKVSGNLTINVSGNVTIKAAKVSIMAALISLIGKVKIN